MLSKSSMYSVGAPHTWPVALGALMWLIDNVKVKTILLEQVDNLHSGDLLENRIVLILCV